MYALKIALKVQGPLVKITSGQHCNPAAHAEGCPFRSEQRSAVTATCASELEYLLRLATNENSIYLFAAKIGRNHRHGRTLLHPSPLHPPSLVQGHSKQFTIHSGFNSFRFAIIYSSSLHALTNDTPRSATQHALSYLNETNHILASSPVSHSAHTFFFGRFRNDIPSPAPPRTRTGDSSGSGDSESDSFLFRPLPARPLLPRPLLLRGATFFT